MQERQEYLLQMQELFWQLHLRMEGLKKALPHTPGCIVRKGLEKQYTYWQIRQNGKQLQRYVRSTDLQDVEKQIRVMKAQKARLVELRKFWNELKRMLRVAGLHWREVLERYEKEKREEQVQEVKQKEAKKVAAGKKYASNYKHMTDRGELVASKSEEMIANMLYTMGIRYEYEKEMHVAGVKLRPDFTVWRRDGSMVIWEHAGLLDDAAYKQQFERRMELYRKEGYTQMKNLIVTYDENGAFSMAMIRRMITAYGLK